MEFDVTIFMSEYTLNQDWQFCNRFQPIDILKKKIVYEYIRKSKENETAIRMNRYTYESEVISSRTINLGLYRRADYR